MGTPQPPRGFPRDLLEGDAAERLGYFWTFTAAHRLQVEADRAVMRALLRARSTRTARAQTPLGTVVLLLGPTGVGKTTIYHTIARRLLARDLPQLEADPGYVPWCYVAAPAPDRNVFRWRALYREALAILNEPLAAQAGRPRMRAAGRPSLDPGAQRPSSPDDELRGAFESALSHRRVEEFWIDEAGHIAKTAGGNALQNQLDLIKSLSDRTATTFVLMGAYDSMVFRALGPQLARRCVEIHVPRYRRERPDDVREFKRVLRTFQKHLPLVQEPDFAPLWELCYDGSVGCIGVLKEWLYRALDAALAENKETITAAILEQEMFSPDRLVSMANAAINGEAEMDEAYGIAKRSELSRLLRAHVGRALDESSGSVDNAPDTNPTIRTETTVDIPPSQSGQQRQPGERTPTRDPAGESEVG